MNKVIFLLIILAISSPPGFSQTNQPPVIIATEHWAPFRIQDPEASFTLRGLDIDIIDMVFKRLGVPYIIVRQPWARCLESMKNGSADLMVGLAFTEERAGYIDYGKTAYYSVGPRFYALGSRKLQVRSYGELASYVIGYSRNSAYFEPFNSDQNLKKYPLTTEAQVLAMLLEGRVDLIIGSDVNVEFDLANLGKRGIVERMEFQPPGANRLFWGMSKKSSRLSLLGQLDLELARLVAAGEVRALADRYLKDHLP